MGDNQFSSSPSEANDILELKLAVLGQTLVGKSALTYRFISDKFPTEHDTTIEDQYKITTTIDEQICRLEILDTAGQDDYQSMLDTGSTSLKVSFLYIQLTIERALRA